MNENELNHIEGKLYSALEELKVYVRNKDKSLYERWEAGGFLVDTNVVSMYPNSQEVIEQLRDDCDKDEDED